MERPPRTTPDAFVDGIPAYKFPPVVICDFDVVISDGGSAAIGVVSPQ